MQTFMVIRAYDSEKDLEDGSVRLARTIKSLGIMKRLMTYIFQVPGQGLATASCYEAEDAQAMAKMQELAELPVGMVRPVRLIRTVGAGVHGEKPMRTYVVNRGKVCLPDEVDSVGERSTSAEEAMEGALKRMEAWLYDDDDKVAMLSVYQSKSIRAIRKHSELANLPVVDIFEARIAP